MFFPVCICFARQYTSSSQDTRLTQGLENIQLQRVTEDESKILISKVYSELSGLFDILPAKKSFEEDFWEQITRSRPNLYRIPSSIIQSTFLQYTVYDVAQHWGHAENYKDKASEVPAEFSTD